MSDFITEKELCSILHVKRLFLYRCRQRGMPFVYLGSKIIRYNLEDVLLWFENSCYCDLKGGEYRVEAD